MSEQRLIDGSKLEKLIRENYDLNYGETLINPREFMYLVENAPTIEAVPVVRGHVAKSNISKTEYMCSACCSDIDRDSVYCKYCGARMDGDSE